MRKRGNRFSARIPPRPNIAITSMALSLAGAGGFGTRHQVLRSAAALRPTM